MARIPIGGELESKAQGGIVVDASAVRIGETDNETLDKELKKSVILSEEEYEALSASGGLKDNVLYYTYES